MSYTGELRLFNFFIRVVSGIRFNF